MHNPRLSTRLILFITISLLLQLIIIALKTKNTAKNTTVTKAQETQCPQPTGNETYQNQILIVGSNIAANNNPENYKQIRALYNCQNPKGSGIQKTYIPVTVVYDLFFLIGDPQGIQNNLEEMKKYGLYPIIRVASYTDTVGKTWIKLYPPTDAKIMGEKLGTALKNVQFPRPPIITYLNEVNLNDEWAGEANPEEFAESILTFSQGLESTKTNNYQLYFPALSYGANGQNGIDPPTYIKRFSDYIDKNSKNFEGFGVNGVALNIYGSSYDDIAQQYNSQRSAFPSENQNSTVITELGPVRNGGAVENCESDQEGWQNVAGPIANGVIQNNLAIATMACFGSVTYPAIVHYDGTAPQLVALTNTGQIQNNTQNTTNNNTTNNTNTNNNTTNNQQQNQTTTGASGLTFNPQNPNSGDQLRVTASSKTALIWVNLAGDGPNGEKINMAGKTPGITRDSQGYHWTYTVDAVKAGTYTFTFSHDCQKYNTKKDQSLSTVCADPVTAKITVTTVTQNSQTQNNTTNTASNITTNNNQQQITIRVPTPGKITLDLSTINPINPLNLEYCKKPQTSSGDCTNPHDQVVDGNTVTMSFPSGNPLIFCGSIDPDKRNQVNGSDRSCIIFYQRT